MPSLVRIAAVERASSRPRSAWARSRSPELDVAHSQRPVVHRHDDGDGLAVDIAADADVGHPTSAGCLSGQLSMVRPTSTEVTRPKSAGTMPLYAACIASIDIRRW